MTATLTAAVPASNPKIIALSINVDAAQDLLKPPCGKPIELLGGVHRRQSLGQTPNRTSNAHATSKVSVAAASSFQLPSLQERRLRRYTVAEEALSTHMRRSRFQPSAEDLKIRALKRATHILSVHAEEAKEHVTQLRKALGDRTIDPQVHRSLQEDCWMRQHRHLIVDGDSKVAQTTLKSLRQQQRPNDYSPADNNPTPTVPKNAAVQRRANLAKFFESPRRYPAKASYRTPLLRPQYIAKRITMAAPLKLSANLSAAEEKRRTYAHIRSLSLDLSGADHDADAITNTEAVSNSRASTSAKARSDAHTSPLEAVVEASEERGVDDETDGSNELRTPSMSVSYPSSPATTEAESMVCPTPPTPAYNIPLPEVADVPISKSSNVIGTATIYRWLIRTPEEILADYGEFNIDLPDYAKELLSHLSHTPSAYEPLSFSSPSNPTRAPSPRSLNRFSTGFLTPPPNNQDPVNTLPRRFSSGGSGMDYLHPDTAAYLSPTSTPVSIPTSTAPDAPPSSKPFLLRKVASRKQLQSLFSIPEAFGSKTGLNAGPASPAVDSESHAASTNDLSKRASFASFKTARSSNSSYLPSQGQGRGSVRTRTDSLVPSLCLPTLNVSPSFGSTPSRSTSPAPVIASPSPTLTQASVKAKDLAKRLSSSSEGLGARLRKRFSLRL